MDEQINDLLEQAATKFEEADEAQREGDTVGWARALDEAEALVQEAFELSGQ